MSDRIVVFEKGLIQQAASPLEIYHRPETRFVAGFIGESNLIPARVADAAAGKAQNPALGACDYAASDAFVDGQDVTLLIRPEHIRLSRKPVDGRKNVRMHVETIVNYGDNALVIGRVGEQPMRVRVLGADVVIIKEGEECCISWLPDSVFVLGR